jgi:hypothetical protein
MRFLLLLFFFPPLVSLAQEDFSWWNDIHHWDGITPWNQYMTISAAHMGPNALPVPQIQNGKIDSTAFFQIAGDYIYGRGDKTKDIYLCGYLPLFKNKISFTAAVIPIEWFDTDTTTRDERAARTRSGKGSAGGDIYLTTSIQLLSNPDIKLEFCMRTASGTRLRDVRYSDGPGYYSDLSIGKNFDFTTQFLRSVRIYSMMGLYVYQTFDLNHLQNDCLLYGTGVDFNFHPLTFSSSFGGYAGYFYNGDHPTVLRFSIQTNDYPKAEIGYQMGLNDYPFESVRVGVRFRVR